MFGNSKIPSNDDLKSSSSKTGEGGAGERPSEVGTLLKPAHNDPSSAAVTLHPSTSPNNNGQILMTVEEANALLGTKIPVDDDKKVATKGKKKDADEGGICSFFPSCSFKNLGRKPQKGIMKGLNRSFPRKRHIIQHWRKQLSNRINRRKEAIIVDGNPDMNITYRELDDFSNSIAFNLKQMKFSAPFENLNPNGEIVIAVCHPACYEYVVIILAVLKLGASLLPINVELPAERIAEILKLTQPVLLIASPQEDDLFEEVLQMVPVDIIYVDEIWNMLVRRGSLDKSILPFKDPIESFDPKNPYPPMWKRTVVVAVVPSDTEDEIQAFSYDSKAFLNRIKWENHFFVYFSSELVLLPPNFETADSIAEVLTALVIGVTLVAYQSVTDVYIPEQLFSYCQTYKIRRLTLWPSLLKACTTAMHLFDFYAQQVRTVRYWFCIGGTMTVELAEIFFETLHPLAQLIHMYHFEDCNGAVTFQSFETLVNQKGRKFYSKLPVGYPVPNMHVYVLDSKLAPVKDGDVGEIWVSGVQLPRVDNYCVKNPFSKHKDRRFMVRTRDYGRILTRSNGTRVLVFESTKARHHNIDDQIIWLKNVEVYLARFPHLVKKSHCVCYRPHEDDQLIIAFCVVASPEINYANVEDELRNILPLHMVPEVVVVKHIPVDPGTGEPDEDKLLQEYQERRLERQAYDDWDKLGLDPYALRAAKILFYAVFSSLGVPVKFLVDQCWNKPYLAIRRATVTKAAFIVKELHRNRYPIFIDDFIYSESLAQIVEIMVEARKEKGFCNRNCPADEVAFSKNRYKLEILVGSHRSTVCSLLAKCFTQRGQLDYYAEVSYASMRRYFDACWPIFSAKKLSIVIRRKKQKNRMVGAVLNMNWHDEMKITSNVVTREIGYKLELIHYLESGITDAHFPQDKTHVFQICYLGLNAKTLDDTEIHGLCDKIIRTLMIFGKVRGFEAIVVICYDFFGWDICVNNYGFNVAKQCQVNQFVASDGTKPYTLCPDTIIASACWKLFHPSENPHHPDKKLTQLVSGLLYEHRNPWS